MSNPADDMIFRMMEETFAGVSETSSPDIPSNPDFELKFQVERKCFLHNDIEIPANFGPFKLLTEDGKKEVEVHEGDPYYQDMTIIFDTQPKCFHFAWDGQQLHLHLETFQKLKVA